MASIKADDLLPAQRLRDAVAEGEITQIHRGDRHADEGDTFLIDGVEYELTEVRKRRLGELTDEDARAEGSPNLEGTRKGLKRPTTRHGTTIRPRTSTTLSRPARMTKTKK
jgi:hypothetical protein